MKLHNGVWFCWPILTRLLVYFPENNIMEWFKRYQLNLPQRSSTLFSPPPFHFLQRVAGTIHTLRTQFILDLTFLTLTIENVGKEK